ncbi:MAG TPA: hypothetical protein VFQ47_06445, partial [Nitrososphaera sp.]|nr:hypothetical protein [Nitrososphaera sp.]
THAIVSGMQYNPIVDLPNLNSLLQLLRLITLRVIRRDLAAGPRTTLIDRLQCSSQPIIFLEQTADQHQAYHVINLKLLACYYCENGGDYSYCSEADSYYDPSHPPRHIYGSFKAC